MQSCMRKTYGRTEISLSHLCPHLWLLRQVQCQTQWSSRGSKHYHVSVYHRCIENTWGCYNKHIMLITATLAFSAWCKVVLTAPKPLAEPLCARSQVHYHHGERSWKSRSTNNTNGKKGNFLQVSPGTTGMESGNNNKSAGTQLSHSFPARSRLITLEYWWMLSHIWASSMPRKPRWPMESQFVSEIVFQEGAGRWFSPCIWHWWDHTSRTVFTVGPLTKRKTLRLWSMYRKGQWSCEGSEVQVLWGVTEGTEII